MQDVNEALQNGIESTRKRLEAGFQKTIDEKVAELRKRFDSASKSFSKMLQQFADFFGEHPELQTVSWEQYTPYFNDGDECLFGVRACEYSVKLDGVDADEFEYKSPEQKAHKAVAIKAADIINSIYEEDMELLGEGEVTINRNGDLTIEECDHY